LGISNNITLLKRKKGPDKEKAVNSVKKGLLGSSIPSSPFVSQYYTQGKH
jgi:hypothetical protein